MSFRTVHKGQVIVQVALLMVVLLAFVALAIDMGNVYAERRRMQNAADAGALAGAWEICFGDPTQWQTAAQEYAIDRNGAQWADVLLNEFVVTVTASETVDTYLAGIVGLRTVDVGAVAAAACGKVTSACGAWPVAFDVGEWDTRKGCGEQFLLWDSDQEADCETWDCDVDGDGDDDYPLDRRAWADFSAILADGEGDLCDSSGCGCSELKYRLDGEDNVGNECRSVVELDKCMAGAVGSGVCSSAWNVAGQQAGRIVWFPLYDQMGCTMQGPDPGDACGNLRYMVRDLACVQVLEAYQLCQKEDPTKCNGPRVILVTVPCVGGAPHPDCASECGTTTGEPPGPGDVRAVSLIR